MSDPLTHAVLEDVKHLDGLEAAKALRGTDDICRQERILQEVSQQQPSFLLRVEMHRDGSHNTGLYYSSSQANLPILTLDNVPKECK
jgi:hypothetical protein